MKQYIDPEEILGHLNSITESYDRASRIMTLGLEGRFRWNTLREASPGKILDVGSGTGSMIKYVRKLYRDSYIVALEPLPNFLEILLRLVRDPCIEVVQGYIEYAPFRQKAFDTATMGFMLRDVFSLSRAIAMITYTSRKIVILDFWRPSSPLLLILQVIYMFAIMILIAAVAPRHVKSYLSIIKTVFRVPPFREFTRLLSSIGLQRIRCWALCLIFSAVIEAKPPINSRSAARA